MSMEFDELKKIRETSGDDTNNMVDFSDEEGYGKFLDLHECYDKFINLKVGTITSTWRLLLLLMLNIINT